MSEEGETTVVPKLFGRKRASGLATQRILQARRRQTDSGSPVNDLATINENNATASSTTSSTTPTPDGQNEEQPTGLFFRRAFRSRQLRGSFRERELEDLDAIANQYSKQHVKDISERTTHSTPATPEVMHEASNSFFGGRRTELLRRSSVPNEFEEMEEPNLMNQFPRRSSAGQSQFGDDFQDSFLSQYDRPRSPPPPPPPISGLESIKQRHAIMAQKLQRMLSTGSEDMESEEVNGDAGQPSDLIQQMSDNPRLSAIYQRLANLGFNKPQASSLPPTIEHIDTLDCEKPKSRMSYDRSSFRDKRQSPAVNQITEVTAASIDEPAEQVEQHESQTLPRRSFLNTRSSIGSESSDNGAASHSVSSLKRQSYKPGAKSLLDEDPFLTSSPTSDIMSPSFETPENGESSSRFERFTRMEPESNFLASMQALRQQITNLHLNKENNNNTTAYTNGVQSDADRFSRFKETSLDTDPADTTIGSDFNQTELNTTVTPEVAAKAGKSPERQVLGAEQIGKDDKLTPKKGKVATKNETLTPTSTRRTPQSETSTPQKEKPSVRREILPSKNEKKVVKNDTPKKEKPAVAKKPAVPKFERTPVKTERQTKPKVAVRASSATLSVGSSINAFTRTTTNVANKIKALETPKKVKGMAKAPEKNTKGPGSVGNSSDIKKEKDEKEEVLSPPRGRKLHDNLAHGGSGVLDVRVTSTDTISSGRNSLESQTDSNQAPSDNADEVFLEDKNFVTNLDREASLSVDSIEGAEKTVELADIKRLEAARRSVRSTSSDFSASYGDRSSSTPGKLRKQIGDVSGRVKAFVKKQQQKGAHREDPDGEEVNSGGYSDGEVKRRSTSDLSMSSSANTGMSRRSSLWSDAQPITDSTMRSKLRSAAGARVNAKDQRILELMMKKREDAQRQQQLRDTAQIAWEEEKARSLKSESGRRSKSQPRVRDRRQSLSTPETSRRTPRNSEADDDKSCDNTPTSVSRVMLERERKMFEKKKQNLERKKSQEQRLAQQEKEKALLNSQIKAKQAQDLKRAQVLKEQKDKDEAKQRRMKSYLVKKKQEDKLHQIRKQSEEEQAELAAALDQKMAIAETNLQVRQERRLADAKQAMTDLERRLELSRQNQMRMQDEMTAWHSELQNYRKMMDEKAKEQTRRQLEDKRAKAAEELSLKKRLQQDNMQRLLEQEDEWKNDVEASIAMKDARSKMIQMEKDELLKESRSLAQASQILREELRMAYSIDHIDKMNRQAELEAWIQKPL